MWQRPSHRIPEQEGQLECCELCGLLVPISRLVVCDVEGLRGRVICDVHRVERRLRFAPSFNDMKAQWTGNLAPDAGTRQEPIGAGFWFEDPDTTLGALGEPRTTAYDLRRSLADTRDRTCVP